MKYLLDSNAVIALLRGHPGFLTRLRMQDIADIVISSIVGHELYFGAYKSVRRSENLARVDAQPFRVLSFDREDARQAGLIRALLTKAATPIGPYDVLIAGQALAREMILITRNLRASFSASRDCGSRIGKGRLDRLRPMPQEGGLAPRRAPPYRDRLDQHRCLLRAGSLFG